MTKGVLTYCPSCGVEADPFISALERRDGTGPAELQPNVVRLRDIEPGVLGPLKCLRCGWTEQVEPRPTPKPPILPDGWIRECVEAWPECETGRYDPRCCRWPKSCSCTIVHDVPETNAAYEDYLRYPDRQRIQRARTLSNQLLDKVTVGTDLQISARISVSDRQLLNDIYDRILYDGLAP